MRPIPVLQSSNYKGFIGFKELREQNDNPATCLEMTFRLGEGGGIFLSTATLKILLTDCNTGDIVPRTGDT